MDKLTNWQAFIVSLWSIFQPDKYERYEALTNAWYTEQEAYQRVKNQSK